MDAIISVAPREGGRLGQPFTEAPGKPSGRKSGFRRATKDAMACS
jgi:hypothetical protein